MSKDKTTSPSALRDIHASLNPDIIARFKTAVECRRWPDGRALTDSQLETCLQAIIAWDAEHLPKEQRIGYMPTKDACPSERSESPNTPEPINTDRLS